MSTERLKVCRMSVGNLVPAVLSGLKILILSFPLGCQVLVPKMIQGGGAQAAGSRRM